MRGSRTIAVPDFARDLWPYAEALAAPIRDALPVLTFAGRGAPGGAAIAGSIERASRGGAMGRANPGAGAAANRDWTGWKFQRLARVTG